MRLGINVDHIATLRQVRGTKYPDPLFFAKIAEKAGADLITVHLREDRRHIQERDVILLLEFLNVPLNLEMAPTQEMLEFAKKYTPHQVTFVPEKREELTTEGGLDVVYHKNILEPMLQSLKDSDIKTALFINADIEQIKMSHKLSASAIEIHTGAYAELNGISREQELSKIADSAKLAKKLGLSVHAGHGLHYHNVTEICEIEEIEEVNIGHAIIAHAVYVGMSEAVKEMKELIKK